MSLPILLTPQQVADWLGTTPKQVYNMVARGQLPPTCIVRLGRRLLFAEAQLKLLVPKARGSLRSEQEPCT